MTKDLTRKLYKERKRKVVDTLPQRKKGSYRKRAKPGKKAIMQGAPEHIRDGNEGRWVSDSSITQIGRRKHSSPSPYSLASKKWTWLHARTLIFLCAGKKRGVAGRNPDARKKLVKRKKIIAEIRDTSPGFCVKEGMPQEEVKGTEGTKGSRTSEKWRSSRGSKKDGPA